VKGKRNLTVLTTKFAFFVLCALCIVAVSFPIRSKRSADLADFTFAIAYQDYPSGVYYDRQFDWPTGEAIWLDLPVWAVDLVLFSAWAGLLVGFAIRQTKAQTRSTA
jgi:hypothetical protein